MRILKLATLSLALLVTHGSATAALSQRIDAPASVHMAIAPQPPARTDVDAARVPPGWGLVLAGLLGGWAIARRRIASIGYGRRQ